MMRQTHRIVTHNASMSEWVQMGGRLCLTVLVVDRKRYVCSPDVRTFVWCTLSPVVRVRDVYHKFLVKESNEAQKFSKD